MDIIYHGKSHDIFFRGKLYNRRQELTVADPMSQADFEALTRKDASTLYTVIYPGVPSDTIKKFIGNDEVNIITEKTCTATEYEALNPPDPYTLYTVNYTNGTKIFLGKKEVGMSNLEYVSCTQSEYDELVSNEEINDYTIYTIVDDNDNPTGKKYFGLLQLIRLETLTKSEYDQLQIKDMNCFYTVTDGGTTKQYLGDLEIGAQMQKIEITQSAYDALTAYDNNTVYVVIDENNNYDVYFRGTMISQNRIREVTLTSSEYEELETYDSRVLYILSDANERYLGDQKVGDDSIILVEKIITENGIYNANNDGARGYSQVTVQTSMVAEGNLFDFTSKRESNGYRNHAAFDPSEGDPQTYETDMSSYAPCCYISEYIPVIESTKYFLVRPEFTWSGCGTVIYNSNKEKLSYVASNRLSYQEITMPANAAFVRLNIVDTTGISLTTCPDFERLCSFCQA